MDDLSESRAGFIHSSYGESEPFAIKKDPDILAEPGSSAATLQTEADEPESVG